MKRASEALQNATFNMELPWFEGLDDAALDAMLHSLEACDSDTTTVVEARASPPCAPLVNTADITVSVKPQLPLHVQLRFPRGDSDPTSSHDNENAAPVSETRGSRKRRQMQQLRDEIDELQSTLSELNKDTHEHSEERTDTGMNSAWQTTVSCQRSYLRRAQTENRKLRRSVEEHNTVIDQLQKVVTQREEHLRTWRLHGRDKPRRVDIQRPEVLESLTEALTSMYLRTDEVLSAPGLARLSPHFTNATVDRFGNSLAIQRIDSRIVPFDPTRTADAVWRYQLDRGSRQRHIEWEELPDGTLRSCFVSNLRVAGFDGYATCYMALRRIVEPDRIVMLRSSIIYVMEDDAAEVSCGSVSDQDKSDAADVKRILLRDSPVRNFLWNTVSTPRHAQLDGTSEQLELSQIHTCSIALPSAISESEAEIAASSKLYSKIAEQMNLQSEEQVDNLLLGSVPPVQQVLRVSGASCKV